MKNALPILQLSAVSIATLAAAMPAGAQTIDIGEVVVTANRTPTEAAKVGSTVNVVTREDIDKQSLPLLSDYLGQIPGISISSQGGAGKETTLIMRGADKKYVKTLFNGIDISDVSATQVQASYEHLLAGAIGRIEVLKGSQSTLYGSDAVAGVIGVSTLAGIEPGLHHEVSIEGGSFGTMSGGYALTGASETGRVAATLHGLSTSGISAALVNGAPGLDGNPALENDFYQNLTGTIAAEQRLNEYLTVFGAGLFINSRGDFDDSGNPPTDNVLNTGDYSQKAARLGFNLDLMEGRFRNTVSVQGALIDRNINTVSSFGPFDGNFVSRRGKVDYQGEFDATDWLTLQFGADHERQTAHITNNFGTDTTDGASDTGLWTQAIVSPVTDLTLTLGLRHDEHSTFGGYTTYRATAAYLLPGSGAKLRASFGTGFRAPSLYESNYVSFIPGVPTPDLDPEESISWDVGVDQKFLDDRLTAGLTYFQLNTDNLIDYDFVNDTYVQLPGVTHRNGVEASLSWAAAPWLDLGAAYTYTHTRQPDGLRRPRVPEHEIALSATVRPAEKWEISGTARGVVNVQDRVSAGFASFVDVPLDDYVLVDAKIAYKPNENTELYVRGENLLDQNYQVVRGYGTPGIGVFAGARLRF
jgi:vitamin B12 transporter